MPTTLKPVETKKSRALTNSNSAPSEESPWRRPNDSGSATRNSDARYVKNKEFIISEIMVEKSSSGSNYCRLAHSVLVINIRILVLLHSFHCISLYIIVLNCISSDKSKETEEC